MRCYPLQYALLLALVLSVFSPVAISHAHEQRMPQLVPSPYDLINAVNALRASYGLAPYGISPTLMTAAQGHADYMAATGNVSHTGLGGSSATDRLLAAGYPLAGDLSLGGFRSENITAGNESTSAQAVVIQWTGDALHLNTMISPNLTEIGAGVTVNGGRAYFVIDCAQPATGGVPQAVETGVGTPVGVGSATATVGGVIIPVVVVTPNQNGDVIHEVKAGQTLWQIAISDETKIDEIKRLNNLLNNEIYPGTKLLVKKGLVMAPSAAPTTSPTALPTVTRTVITAASESTSMPERVDVPRNNMLASVIGIIVIAILLGGIITQLGNSK